MEIMGFTTLHADWFASANETIDSGSVAYRRGDEILAKE
jgi:hypothetical protein